MTMDKEKTGRIASLRRMLTGGELSCEELTGRYLAAIEKDNPALNAYVTVTADTALHTAQQVDKKLRAGEELSPLEGIPMTLKDNISTKGIETTCCSNILRGYRPIYDATVWKLLREQNAVLLGKTNMDEFAMGSSCETSCYGGALNPHDTGHVSGGSSGGVAAAVGGNLAVYGLGSDTGGSIRQPASFCGLVGLKPTYGAVSRYGLIAYASSFDQIGPITYTVEDASLVYDAISRYDERDSTSQGRKGAPAADSLRQDIRGMKIGVADEYFEGLREDVRHAMDEAVAAYRSLGAEIVRFRLPSLQYALPVYYILACAEASSNLGRYDGIRYGYQTPRDYRRYQRHRSCKTRRRRASAPRSSGGYMLGTYVLRPRAITTPITRRRMQPARASSTRAFRRGSSKSATSSSSPTSPHAPRFELMISDARRIRWRSVPDRHLHRVRSTSRGPARPGSVPCGADEQGAAHRHAAHRAGLLTIGFHPAGRRIKL